MTVTLTEKLDDKQACSFITEAKCDSPWVKMVGTPTSWPTGGADAQYSVIEYMGDSFATPYISTADKDAYVPSTPASITGMKKMKKDDVGLFIEMSKTYGANPGSVGA